jgi:hypothetical protein
MILFHAPKDGALGVIGRFAALLRSARRQQAADGRAAERRRAASGQNAALWSP